MKLVDENTKLVDENTKLSNKAIDENTKIADKAIEANTKTKEDRKTEINERYRRMQELAKRRRSIFLESKAYTPQQPMRQANVEGLTVGGTYIEVDSQALRAQTQQEGDLALIGNGEFDTGTYFLRFSLPSLSLISPKTVLSVLFLFTIGIRKLDFASIDTSAGLKIDAKNTTGSMVASQMCVKSMSTKSTTGSTSGSAKSSAAGSKTAAGSLDVAASINQRTQMFARGEDGEFEFLSY